MKTAWGQKRRVMRSYNSTAELYDSRYAKEQESKYKVALGNIQPSGVVLDVGCGSGLFFKHISNETRAIVGIDISRRLLCEARKNSDDLQNVHLILSDADHLPLKNNIFNVVFTFTLLQNMPEPAITLEELARVAKLNAKLVVTGLKKVFSKESLQRILNDSGLSQTSLIDDDSLSCFLVFGLKRSK